MTDEIKKELEQIVEVIINTVDTEEIYLFGSFARGEEREDSDFDLYTVLGESEERPLVARQKIALALYKLNKRGLDILAEYGSLFYNEGKNTSLERMIAKEGVRLYGKSV